MVESAGITLREAIEGILVIFIMTAYLEKTGRAERKKYVYAGAIVAAALSFMLAVFLSVMGINPENELIEGVMLFLAAILVGSLVVWMWRKAKFIKQEIEVRVEKTASTLALASIAFVMVFREWVETVIFLQSLLLAGSSSVENFLGGILGVALAVVFGMVFLKGVARINLSRFFKVTSAILAILVIKLIASGFHEFFEVGLLPSNEAILEVVGFLAKDSTGAAVIALMLVALIFTVIYDVVKTPMPDLSSLRPAERRKVRYEIAKEKYSKIALGVVLLAVIMVMLAPTIIASDVVVPEPVPVEAENGLVKVKIPEEDGFYKFKFGEARFLMVIKNGEPHVGLDRCYICPPKGYGYNGEVLICTNCDAPIEPKTVGIPGGCNPRVIDFSVQGGVVTINSDELIEAWSVR